MKPFFCRARKRVCYNALMEIVKLLGATQNYIWGGHKLIEAGKVSSSPILAESWELSFHDDGPSIIASGVNKGMLLKEVATADDLGINPCKTPMFPVLIKLIDSASNLSVQIHPSDEYALKNEHSLGKTEMWHIIDAEPGCGIYLGLKRDSTKEEVEKAVKEGTIMDLLNFYECKKGDTFFIPSGTIHAIGKGCTLIEIQQNSNITYRLYDYGRVGADGKPRELHLSKALEVMNYKKFIPQTFEKPTIGECAYFHVELSDSSLVVAPDNSFATITILDGEGTFAGIPFKKFDTFFIPARKSAAIIGKAHYVYTRIP